MSAYFQTRICNKAYQSKMTQLNTLSDDVTLTFDPRAC